MVQAGDSLRFLGRVTVQMETHLRTGLHIGAGAQAIAVGGMDNPVVRHPVTREPYIPGSSLKGRMRALLERLHALPMGQRINQVWIHSCWPVGVRDEEAAEAMRRNARENYRRCPVCRVFGVAAEAEEMVNLPTRLLVDDAFLTEESRARLQEADTDLPFTEVKWEASIDRVTSAANPRAMERVPAGAVFEGPALSLSFYAFGDYRDGPDLLDTLIQGLRLVQEEGLGGSISRGYGRVAFRNLRLSCVPACFYTGEGEGWEEQFEDLRDLWRRRKEVRRRVAETLGLEG